MYFPKRVAAIGRYAIVAVSLIPGMLAQKSEDAFHEPFQEGCCLDHSFPRPDDVSRSTLSATRLREALNCTANNRFIGGARYLAKALGDQDSLRVAYHYGVYMLEQEEPALTIAVYSVDGQHGVLFDQFGSRGDMVSGTCRRYSEHRSSGGLARSTAAYGATRGCGISLKRLGHDLESQYR